MLLHLGDTEYVLLVVTHHIIFDGWSVSILVRELATLYDAICQDTPCCLPPLPIQYADFARRQQEQLQGTVLHKQLAFWQEHLGRHVPVLDLPTDRPRPPLQTLRGAQHTLLLPVALRDALKALSQQEGATLFMTLLTAFQALLQRDSAQDDIVVGVPVAGRHDVETEALIGVFVNSLLLRTELSGNPSFCEALQRLRGVALHAYAHQDVPFEKLVETLQPQRDLSRTPLFQVMFQLRNLPNTTMAIHGLRIEEYEFDRQVAMFDIAVDIREQPSGLACVFEYNIDLFEAMTIRAMAEHFHMLLAGIVAHPQQRLAALPLLTAAERQQVLVTWNATRTPLPQHRGIHELFAAQVARTPDAVAVEDGAHSLTYQALNQRANQLTHYLQRHGVGPEILVGLCVKRSIDMLIGLLGILKAGGAYVPLDPSYPQERLAFMLQDTAVPIVLIQQRLSTSLPTRDTQLIALDSDWPLMTEESQANPSCSVTAQNLAYVIYTSGSTGQPKGVLIEHQALVNYTEAAKAMFALTAQDRVLQFASLNFEEIFTCLTRGATLVLRPDNMLDSVPLFLNTFEIGEIEALLHRHPAVRQALVTVRQDTPGNPRLLAYLIAHHGPRPSTSAMRHFVQHTLPAYMIPTAFVWMEAFPLLPNGKVDYHSLPAPDFTGAESAQAFIAPKTIVEDMLARLWQVLLGVQHVGSHDDFFALGGHSLLVAQLTAHITALLQVALPLRQVCQTPTLTALAQAVLAHESRPGQTEKIARILKHLADMPEAAPHTPGGIAGFSPTILALLPSFLTVVS